MKVVSYRRAPTAVMRPSGAGPDVSSLLSAALFWLALALRSVYCSFDIRTSCVLRCQLLQYPLALLQDLYGHALGASPATPGFGHFAYGTGCVIAKRGFARDTIVWT
ncbi:hypothetical protein CERSUDRAFT_119666 [Gelatoporia subvermispora B]|uniref:Uncharacterized protein n=1 Tax=Ceriporiopsis subvermispora (strain B) TaxID=914234 RepID=M2Q499_CERS8|nr:hypothetical protein CERSUDRAFT_119666 [Gelatoporia subvermispora B]